MSPEARTTPLTYDAYYNNSEIVDKVVAYGPTSALGPKKDLGPYDHPLDVRPYTESPTLQPLDVEAEMAANTVNVELPEASPALSGLRKAVLEKRIINAREKEVQLTRTPRVAAWTGKLLLRHTTWVGVAGWNNPLRPATATQRYVARRMDTQIEKEKIAINKRNHFMRGDGNRSAPMSEGILDYASETKAPPSKADASISSGPEKSYYASLNRKAKRQERAAQRKKNRFDRFANSEDLIGKVTQARATHATKKVQKLEAKYTGASGRGHGKSRDERRAARRMKKIIGS